MSQEDLRVAIEGLVAKYEEEHQIEVSAIGVTHFAWPAPRVVVSVVVNDLVRLK